MQLPHSKRTLPCRRAAVPGMLCAPPPAGPSAWSRDSGEEHLQGLRTGGALVCVDLTPHLQDDDPLSLRQTW